MIGRLKDMFRDRDDNWVVSFTTKERMDGDQFDELSRVDCDITIKKHHEKRSKDANAFCWSLCNLIGNAMKPPLPKEEVYRKAIRDVGDYEPLPIKNKAVQMFQRRWADKGIGWFADVIDDSKIEGYKLVFAYYGSSTYDTASMSRLIDHLIDDAEQMGLAIPLGKNDVERLKNDWRMQE